MRLELCSYDVKEVQFSSQSKLEGGVLSINKAELEELLSKDGTLKKVQVELASPGEETRIIHILDLIEPRIKVEGPGCAFPGFLGPPRVVGEGRTNRLKGVAVIETAELPYIERGLLHARELIVDMFGLAAAYSPFSKTLDVVLNFEPVSGTILEDYERSIRFASLKAATYLAGLSLEVAPDETEVLELGEQSSGLPNIAYIYQLSSSGPLVDTFLYGEPIRRLLATLIHPNEIIDGAIVSGRYSPHPVPTYVHCNNPVIKELYRHHGKELNFVGVVLTYGGGLNPTSFAKQRAAYHTAKLAKFLRADGVILTQEGGGNSIMDQMLISRCCEELGIRNVVVTYETAGIGGNDPPLIYMVPEADAVVSVGNRDEKILLPPARRVLGGRKILYTNLDAGEGLELFVHEIASAIGQAGSSPLRTELY